MSDETTKVQYVPNLINGMILYLPPDPLADYVNTETPDIWTPTSTQQYPLGTGLQYGDRFFRYAKAGAACDSLGRLLVNSNYCPGATGHANEDGFEGALYAAATAGDTYVDIADTTARAKNYYEGAMLIVFTSGTFQMLRVKSSDVGNGSTHVRCYLSDVVQADISTSVGVTAYLSPFSAVKAAMSTNQEYEPFVGLALADVASGYYFWLMRRGPCWITAHGGTWPGSAAHYRDVFAWMDGTVDPSSVADPTSGYQRVGYLLSATVSGYGDAWVQLQLE